MQFSYTARTATGVIVDGVLEAPDRFVVARTIRAQNQVPLTVVPIIQKKKNTITLFDSVVSRVSLREKIVFINNLSGMLTAGLTLYRALEVERNQTQNVFFKKMLTGVLASINQGQSLSEALGQYPATFSSLFVAMIRASEESGNLSKTLKEIGVTLEKSSTLSSKVRGALLYPAIIFCTIIIVAILMLIFVVPTLTHVFGDLGAKLPATTRFVVGLSDFMVQNTLIVLISIVCLAIAGYIFMRTEKTRRLRDMIALRLPIVKTIIIEVHVARTARTLSSLLLSGIEMTHALSVTRDVLQNTYYKDVLAKAQAGVERGESLSSIFKSEPRLYPIMVGEMVAVGEETGAISQMCEEIAHFYEEDIDQKTKNLSTIIEPVVMLFIGVAVGFFAISMISPMYNLLSVVSSK